MKSIRQALAIVAAVVSVHSTIGCGTAPKAEDREAFKVEAAESRDQFLRTVSGLEQQLKASAGYAVFPGVGQWGLLFGGGSFGRGAVYTGGGTQVGWAAVSNPSIGLQLGGQGVQMLLVFQTTEVFDDFKAGGLKGSASATAVGGESGASAVAAYSGGVALYTQAQKGLMAGASVGLQYFRYMSLEDAQKADQ